MKNEELKIKNGGGAARVLAAIRAHRRFLVTTHARGDGDALGSMLAAQALLRRLGKRAQAVHDGPLTDEYRSLPGARGIGLGPGAVRPGFDAVLVVDAADAGRYEGLKPAIPAGTYTINVDHHVSNTRFGDVNWVDGAASSAGELVWGLVRAARIRVTRDIATNLYAAILTDTGRFSFSNTSAVALGIGAALVAAGARPGEISKAIYRNRTREDLRLLGACMAGLRMSEDGRIAWLRLTADMVREAGGRPRDSQEYIEMAKSVRGVRVALLFRDTDGPGLTKVSIRTEPGVDASALAAVFGGGGHRRAAGATIRAPLADAEAKVLAETARRMAAGRD